jgi:hypothetical protein
MVPIVVSAGIVLIHGCGIYTILLTVQGSHRGAWRRVSNYPQGTRSRRAQCCSAGCLHLRGNHRLKIAYSVRRDHARRSSHLLENQTLVRKRLVRPTEPKPDEHVGYVRSKRYSRVRFIHDLISTSLYLQLFLAFLRSADKLRISPLAVRQRR